MALYVTTPSRNCANKYWCLSIKSALAVFPVARTHIHIHVYVCIIPCCTAFQLPQRVTLRQVVITSVHAACCWVLFKAMSRQKVNKVARAKIQQSKRLQQQTVQQQRWWWCGSFVKTCWVVDSASDKSKRTINKLYAIPICVRRAYCSWPPLQLLLPFKLFFVFAKCPCNQNCRGCANSAQSL